MSLARPLVLALALPLVVAASVSGKETPDPLNRIFLVGDVAEWLDTKVNVRPQDHLTIRAGSEVCFSGGRDESCVRSVGWPRESYAESFPDDAAACTDPFPEWNHAALVARVGDEPVLVGRQTVVSGLEGRLTLSINDCSFDGDYRNDGQFSVVIVAENPTAFAARGGRELIAAAIEALGGKAINGVTGLRVRAACTGPGGPFTTEVITLEPDQTLFKQSSEEGSSEWLAQGDKAWRIDRERGKRKPAKKMLRMIRGHEFHDLLFHLDERFQEHTVPASNDGDEGPQAPDSETDGCVRVEMRDLYGAPAAVCLDPESFMPVRLSYQPAGRKKEPTIEMELETWLEIDDVQYLESFTLRHGEDVFTYRYEQILPNGVSRANFSAVSPRAFKAIRKRLKKGPAEQPAMPTEEPADTAEESVESPTGS